jgi:sterol desaturase/sphingolipid hydroxylase (fatty acid hydroxylase superfamily)
VNIGGSSEPAAPVTVETYHSMQETLTVELSAKQEQFNAAMNLYNSKIRYRILAASVSIIIIALQLYLLSRIWPLSIGAGWQVLSILTAYLLTDFINGLVHMFMDNNDRYDSLAGPLIANFHLHHKIPLYKKNNLLIVYFTETGSKIWLVLYLLTVLYFQAMFEVDSTVLYTLVYIGILSSVAEVSHYLCHSSTSATAGFLGDIGLLLSKRHHAKHHLQDNNNYAFLNGFTDPLLNRIAAAWYKGYKNNTDLHYANYVGVDSEKR